MRFGAAVPWLRAVCRPQSRAAHRRRLDQGPKNPHGRMRPSGTGIASSFAAWRMLGGRKCLMELGEAEGNNTEDGAP